MTTYTITVGAADGFIAGDYGFAPAVPSAWSAFGSVSPPGSVVYAFYWAPDGSLVSIEADTPGGDLSVVWNGQTYTLADQGGGYAAYQDVGLGGPYPTSGTTYFDIGPPSGYTLAVAAGAFAEAGQTAALIAARGLASSAGAIALSGQAAGLLYGRLISGGVGSVAFTGQAAGLVKTGIQILGAATGSFSASGQTVGLGVTRVLGASTGTFSLSGQGAAFSKAYAPFSVDGGVFTEAGHTAGLYRGLRLAASAASFSLSGIYITFRSTRPVHGDAGAFIITGGAVNFYTNIKAPKERRIVVPQEVRTHRPLPVKRVEEMRYSTRKIYVGPDRRAI